MRFNCSDRHPPHAFHPLSGVALNNIEHQDADAADEADGFAAQLKCPARAKLETCSDAPEEIAVAIRLMLLHPRSGVAVNNTNQNADSADEADGVVAQAKSPARAKLETCSDVPEESQSGSHVTRT